MRAFSLIPDAASRPESDGERSELNSMCSPAGSIFSFSWYVDIFDQGVVGLCSKVGQSTKQKRSGLDVSTR